LKVRRLPEEPGKDTPRFPPYPRYKCAWEYLVRILGLKMDEQFLYLSPFRTIDFTLNEVTLAGTSLSVTVQSGWTTAVVDGEPVTGPVRLSRSKDRYKVEFRG